MVVGSNPSVLFVGIASTLVLGHMWLDTEREVSMEISINFYKIKFNYDSLKLISVSIFEKPWAIMTNAVIDLVDHTILCERRSL